MNTINNNCPSERHRDENKLLCSIDITIEKFAIHSVSKVFPIVEVIIEFLHIPGFIRAVENNCKHTLPFKRRLRIALMQIPKIVIRLIALGAAYTIVDQMSTAFYPSAALPEFLKPVFDFMCAYQAEKVINNTLFAVYR